MSYFETLSFPEKIHYFFVACPDRALCAILCLGFSMLALLMLVQCFIRPLRRLYVAVFRWCLQHTGIRRAQEYATVLGAWVAWLGFSFSFCLIPVCMAFYADAASHYSGPMPVSFLFVFGPSAFLMMVVAFIIVSLWALVRWALVRWALVRWVRVRWGS